MARTGRDKSVPTMNFIQLWLTGYINPARLIEGLRAKPAPHYGFFAQLLRGGLVGLFLYLPLAVLGRTPPTPSYIPALPTGTYYGTLVWLGAILSLSSILVPLPLAIMFMRSPL